MARSRSNILMFAGVAVVVILIVYFSMKSTGDDTPQTQPIVKKEEEEEEEEVVDTTPVEKPMGPIQIKDDAEKIDNQSWRDNNPGAVIKKLGACGEAKTYDNNMAYEGPSRDNYANYCYNFIKSVECADKTCSVPQVFGACRDECTGRMNSGQRISQIGAGAGRVTYPEYKAWRDKTAYPGSGKMTWVEHCAWKAAQSSLDNNMIKCT